MKTEFERGQQDMLETIDAMLVGAINNPSLDMLSARMALQVLLASIRSEDFQ